MKAFRVTIRRWNDFEIIMPARTHGHAKGLAYIDGKDAGYSVQFTDFRARRAPEFDDVANEAEGKIPYWLGWRDGGERWGCLSIG